MNGSGCEKCPVKNCDATYRGSRCAAQRSKYKLGDPQTNADRIREMNDEELQKFLLEFESGDIDYAKTFCDLCCKDAALERKNVDCEGCLLWWLKNNSEQPQGLDWLKQEVSE